MKSSPVLVSLILLAGCLAFFFPLLTVQVPLLGTQDFSGYDLVHRSEEFNRAAKAIDQDAASAPQEGESNSATTTGLAMPWSVENLQLLPLEIFFALGLSLAAFVLCVFEAPGIARFAAAIGAVLAIAAVLHLTVANSDPHSWMSQKMASVPKDDNPFVGLVTGMASMALAAFQIKAGVGLYGLAASLSLAATLLFGQAGEPHDDYDLLMDEDTESLLKSPAVLLGAFVAGVALLWFFVLNKPKPRVLTPLASSFLPTPAEAKRLVARIRNNHFRVQPWSANDEPINIQFAHGKARDEDAEAVFTIDTSHIAFGDLDGDGKLDALVVPTARGDSGTGYFERLVGILDVRGVETTTIVHELGDRVEIRGMSINRGVARVNLVTQGPDDPMCCPSQKEALSFRLRNNRFIDMR